MNNAIAIDIAHIVTSITGKTCPTLLSHYTSKDVPGWDSLSNMLIMDKIEKHYGISFTWKEVQKLSTIEHLIALVELKTSK